jgi:uncharacterized protein involved in outer membrane biogenesis
MKRAILVGLGVVLVLVAALLTAPSLIDWNRFKPLIAQEVQAAVGRGLRIEGDLDVSLLQGIEFSALDIHLANPPGFSAPDLASIESIRGSIQVWPLLRRQLVVDTLVVEKPDVRLEVDEAGKANFLLRPRKSAEENDRVDGRRLPFSDLRLGDVRLTGGVFSYRDAVSGQDLAGRNLDMTAVLQSIDSPLAVAGSFTLNDEPVTLIASLAPFDALLGEGSGRVGAKLSTKHVDADLTARVEVEPAVGLDGNASLEIASIGALAGWLGVPWDHDPGPLKLQARFKSDGPVVALEEAKFEGDQLSVHAAAMIDVSDEAIEVVLNVEGGVVDIDHYMPPFLETTDESPADQPGSSGSLDALLDAPFNLGALRNLTADISVSIDGVRMAGYAVGPIRLDATAKDGLLVGDLEQIGLYDGTIAGSLSLDASADSLAVRTDIDVTSVEVGAMARVAADDGTPLVIGAASGQLRARTTGRTGRALAENMVGKLVVGLESWGKRGAAGRLTALSIGVDRPEADAQVEFAGQAVYNGEEVTLDVVADPLLAALAGTGPVAVQARIDSGLLTASYQGRFVRSPVMSLDGTFHAEATSVGRLGSWLGRPLAEGQDDPGALEIHAVFRSDGVTGNIEEARVLGGGISLSATGEFDARGEVARFDLALDGGVLDLDPYLPASGTSAAGTTERDGATSGREGRVATASEPTDLAPWRRHAGQIRVSLEGVKARGVEFGEIDLNATLEDGLLELAFGEVEVARGTDDLASAETVSARLQLWPLLSRRLVVEQLRVERPVVALAIDEAGRLNWKPPPGKEVATNAPSPSQDTDPDELPFDDLVLDDVAIVGSEVRFVDRRSGRRVEISALDLHASLRARGTTLPESPLRLDGRVEIGLERLTLEPGPLQDVRDVAAVIVLPEADDGPTLQADLVVLGAGGDSIPVGFTLQVGSISELLRDGPDQILAQARIGEVTTELSGRFTVLTGDPSAMLDVSLTTGSLTALEPLLEGAMPDVGPVEASGRLIMEPERLALESLTARIGSSDFAGTAQIALAAPRPVVSGRLTSGLFNFAALRSGVRASSPGKQETSDGASDGQASPTGRIIPDTPLRLAGLRGFDADLELNIGTLQLDAGSAINEVLVGVRLVEGRLELDPLRTTGTDGGTLDGTLVLDAGQEPPTLNVAVELAGVRIGGLLKEVTLFDPRDSVARASVDLSSRGTSPRDLAAALNGHVEISAVGGTFDLGAAGLLASGVTDLLSPLLGGGSETELRCFLVRYEVSDGLATSVAQVLDTPTFAIGGGGEIDLRTEEIELHFRPEPYSVSLMSFAAPFNVTGTLRDPRAVPDVAGTVVSAAKSTFLVLNPVTVLGALTAGTLAGGNDNACVAAVQAARSSKGGVAGAAESVLRDAGRTVEGAVTTGGKIVEGAIEGAGEVVKGIGRVFDQ